MGVEVSTFDGGGCGSEMYCARQVSVCARVMDGTDRFLAHSGTGRISGEVFF